jgi:hypothetical protein
MSTPERISNENTDSEVSRGTVCVCTAEDRPALTELHRAAHPESTNSDLAADLRDAHISSWAAFKDGEGDIRVAMFVWPDGVIWVLAKPEDADSDAVKRGFLWLAREVQRELASSGVTKLTVFHAKALHRFGEILEQEGFLSKEVMVVRTMHFSESGEVQRMN